MKVTADYPWDPANIPNVRGEGTINLSDAVTQEDYSNENLPNLTATIARAQWEDYIARFAPIEDALMQQTYYENPAIVGETINKAMPQVNAAIDTSKGVQMRRLEAMGQHLTPADQARFNQDWELQRSLARTDAANRIRQNIAARSRDIAFGGANSRTSAIALPNTNTGA